MVALAYCYQLPWFLSLRAGAPERGVRVRVFAYGYHVLVARRAVPNPHPALRATFSRREKEKLAEA